MPKTSFFDRLENRIFIIIVLTTLASATAVFTFLSDKYHSLMVEEIRSRTQVVNTYALDIVNAPSFTELNIREDTTKPVYASVQAELNRIRKIANVRYLFTAKRNAEGKLIYLIDGLDSASPDFRYVGDLVEPEIVSQLDLCLSGTRVEAADIINTEWGAIFATCWPVEVDGSVVGALFMEFDADSFYKKNVKATFYSSLVSIGIALFFIMLAKLSLKRVSEPVYKRLAYTDLLTGAGNRNAFELDLKHIEANLKDDKRTLFIVAYDLNRLKEINDRYGHAAGDSYIRKMASVLLDSSWGDECHHYRIGGDEFATIIRGGKLSPIKAQLDEMFLVHHEAVLSPEYFEFSYGLAQYDPERDHSLHELLTLADMEMYRFKVMIKNHFVHSDDALD